MKVSTRKIRSLGRRADTILLKARELACDINNLFGNESSISDAGDDVLCTAEALADELARMPDRIKNGGQP